MKCWICGAEEAATREHLAKASDLKALFGKPSQRHPLYFHASDRPGMPRRRNIRVGSLKSDTLKFAHRICLTCNSARTHAYSGQRDRSFWSIVTAAHGMMLRG